MKKNSKSFLFAITLVLVFVLTMTAVPSLAADVNENDWLVQSFSDKTVGTSGLNEVSNSSAAVQNGTFYVPDINGDAGCSLKIATNSSTVSWDTVLLSPNHWWFANNLGIQFYMKREGVSAEGEPVSFGYSEAGEWELFHLSEGQTVSLLPKGSKTWQKSSPADAGGTTWIPGGFEGIVEIPFSAVTYWWGGNGDKQLNLQNIQSVLIVGNISNTVSYTVDNIVAVTQLERPVPREESLIPIATYDDKTPGTSAEDAILQNNDVDVSYVTELNGEGTALKISGNGNSTWPQVQLNLLEAYNLSGMNGIEMEIKKYGSGDNGAYRFGIGEGGGEGSQWELFRLASGSNVLYKQEGSNTWTPSAVFDDGVVMLPTNFTGKVRVSFDTLSYWYNGVNGDQTMNLADAFGIIMSTDVNDTDEYVVINSIYAYGEKPAAPVSDTYTVSDNGIISSIASDTSYSTFTSNLTTDSADITYKVMNGENIVEAGNVATGMYVQMYVLGEESNKYYLSVRGDLSGDGSFTAQDLVLLRKALLGSVEFSNSQKEALNIYTGDDINVDILALVHMKKALAVSSI